MERGPLRILIVQHEDDAGPGLIGERLAAAGCAVTVCAPPNVVKDAVPIPPDPHGFDGMVVLGGSPGPTDDVQAPWLPKARSLIAAALADDIPQLCVCLGAQLLAVVAGGQVRPLAGGAEIGVTPLWLSDAAFGDPLFGGIEPPLEAAQWHELEVAELPPGARLLSRGETCRNQAFRVGRSAWGLQFHLEVLPDGFARWARDGTDDLDRAGLRSADVIDDVRTAESSLRALWAPVIDQWVSVCIERRDVFSA